MKKRLIKPLNKHFVQKDTVKMIQKSDYFEVFCKYEGCNYCMRYSYSDCYTSLACKSSQSCTDDLTDKDQGSVFDFTNYFGMKEQLKYDINHTRTVNGHHSLRAHQLAIVKPVDSLIDVK